VKIKIFVDNREKKGGNTIMLHISAEFESAIYEAEKSILEIPDLHIQRALQNICEALREIEKKIAELKTY
jgi:hypothetical protein